MSGETVLSIVMPCYDCAGTLEEAVASIAAQGFEQADISYEVIMVDDGSTDGTWKLIGDLAKKYPHIRTMKHERNRGGGAARNTGIRVSAGRYIYCLDADNILAPDSLAMLVRQSTSSGCDGSAFEERRFFRGSDHSRYKAHRNAAIPRSLALEDLWKESGPFLDNFMFSREAYERAGGYPEHHGFDTQCFEVRFLASGNSLMICPGSVFYHRQAMKDARSYFERVYESGRFSENYYLIFEDIFQIFSGKIQREIIGYDIYAHAGGRDNIKTMSDALYRADPKGFFHSKIMPHTPYQDQAREASTNPAGGNAAEKRFSSALSKYRRNDHAGALREFHALTAEIDGPIPYLNMMRSVGGLIGLPKAEHVAYAHAASGKIALQAQKPVFEHPSALRKFARKARARLMH